MFFSSIFSYDIFDEVTGYGFKVLFFEFLISFWLSDEYMVDSDSELAVELERKRKEAEYVRLRQEV